MNIFGVVSTLAIDTLIASTAKVTFSGLSILGKDTTLNSSVLLTSQTNIS